MLLKAMKNVIISLFAILILAGLSSCSNDGVTCTAENVYGLTITLHEFETGQAITTGKVVGIARDGNYTDTLQQWHRFDSTQAISLSGAGERAGKYAIRINLEGYEPWMRENVIVTRDECHVHPQKITAFLKKK
jgi:hypothetical protein